MTDSSVQLTDEREERIARGLVLSEWAQTLTIANGASIILTLLAWRTLTEPKAADWFTVAQIGFLIGAVCIAWSLIAAIKAWRRVHLFAKADHDAYAAGQHRIANLSSDKRFIWQSDRYGKPKP